MLKLITVTLYPESIYCVNRYDNTEVIDLNIATYLSNLLILLNNR